MDTQDFLYMCACDILEIKELPTDLHDYLNDMEIYANRRGGNIMSRQVISAALINYYEIKDLKEEIELLKTDIVNITSVLMKTELNKPNEYESKLHDNDWSYEDPDGTTRNEYK